MDGGPVNLLLEMASTSSGPGYRKGWAGDPVAVEEDAELLRGLGLLVWHGGPPVEPANCRTGCLRFRLQRSALAHALASPDDAIAVLVGLDINDVLAILGTDREPSIAVAVSTGVDQLNKVPVFP